MDSRYNLEIISGDTGVVIHRFKCDTLEEAKKLDEVLYRYRHRLDTETQIKKEEKET